MNNEYALVTGSGSGIGRAIAIALARTEIPVIVNDIVTENGHLVVAEIVEQGGNAQFVRADIGNADEVRRMFEEASNLYGIPRILVNNAGSPGKFALIADMEDQDWHKSISTHVNGAFYCLREAARRMSDRGGHIVNIASIAGLDGAIGSAGYAAAKAGLINLSKSAAKELGHRDIMVNAIAPGMVATPINRNLEKKGSPFISTALDGTPLGRMTEPEEIAALTAFLCTKTRSVTGQVIVMDGGATLTAGSDKFMLNYLHNSCTNA